MKGGGDGGGGDGGNGGDEAEEMLAAGLKASVGMNAGGEKDGGDAGAVDAGRCHRERETETREIQPHQYLVQAPTARKPACSHSTHDLFYHKYDLLRSCMTF